jgi:hypothetical protein
MKTLFLPLILLFVSTAVRAQSSEEILISSIEQKRHERQFDSYRLGSTSASENFDVHYYRAEWEVNPALKYIKGKVAAHFTMTEGGNSISLDLASNLMVAKVEQAGNPLTFTHANNTLQINFALLKSAGSADSVSIYYEGTPQSTALEISAHGDVLPLSPIMWTLSEPNGSKDWWPCKNGLDDKADSIDIYINTPLIYKAAANGILQSEIQISGGRTIAHWKHRYPIASYLVSFAVTNYVVFNDYVTIGATNVPMQTYCYPENASTFQAGAQTAMNAMKLFSTLFGDYPFKNEKYGHVQFGWGGGMEHQTCSFMNNMGETLIAHELAHQWFGDKVTCATWHDVWLNEGFATYLVSLYSENKYPQTILPNRAAAIDIITSEAGGSVWVDDINDFNRIFNHRLSYVKGSCLLQMLRWILGDDVFFTALKNYLNDPAISYEFASTNDLKKHLEVASGQSLQYFFDQWFTGQGYPSYQVEWYQKNSIVELKLNQTTSHPSVNFFSLPVPLLFRNTKTNQEKLVVVKHSTNGQTFKDNIGFEADTMIFDPEKWLVSKNNTITKSEASLPVKFVYFKIECSEYWTRLLWETSEEVNVSHFQIQKSTDAISWITIGSIAGKGGSTNVQYTYEDSTYAAGTYFRIVEVDTDGARQCSRVNRSTCGVFDENKILISPNPAEERLVFEIANTLRLNKKVFLFNLKGNLIQALDFDFQSDKRKYEIDISFLPPGLYIMKLQNADEKLLKSARFIKK